MQPFDKVLRCALYSETNAPRPDYLAALALPRVDAPAAVDTDRLLHWDGEKLRLKDLREPRSRSFAVAEKVLPRRQAKRGPLAQSVGPRSKTVIDATAGWGGDSLLLFTMGYQVTAIERHPLVAAMLTDGFRRLPHDDRHVPTALAGDAADMLYSLPSPDCIFLDPMFPSKRKSSALPRRSLRLLRELVGDDQDAEQLLGVARSVCRRVVVKRADDSPAIGKPDTSFAGKLVRYDVYFSQQSRT